MTSTRTNLYRCFDVRGRILYIGISGGPAGRLCNHAVDSPWFPSVRSITVCPFRTRNLAAMAEKAAILKERPKFNRQYLPSRGNDIGVFGSVRLDPDVKLLVSLAMLNLTGAPYKNINRLGNHALRKLLTPLVGNKQIRAMQDRLGVGVESNGK